MDFLTINQQGLHDQIQDYLHQIEEKLKPLLSAIKKGSVIRNLQNELYQHRMTYTNALRRIVYHPALFNEILLDDQLKTQFFQAFGYKGNLDFRIYPTAWLRDLALTDYSIGKGAYLADYIVLGTNQVSPCQKKITVGPIRIGDETIFDQHCKIGLNTQIGHRCVVGISCHIGLVCQIGDDVKIGPLSAIGHFVKIQNHVRIGANCMIGHRSVIEEGAVIPDHAKIPTHSLVKKNNKILPITAVET